jgi:hypothetical protein
MGGKSAAAHVEPLTEYSTFDTVINVRIGGMEIHTYTFVLPVILSSLQLPKRLSEYISD